MSYMPYQYLCLHMSNAITARSVHAYEPCYVSIFACIWTLLYQFDFAYTWGCAISICSLPIHRVVMYQFILCLFMRLCSTSLISTYVYIGIQLDICLYIYDLAMSVHPLSYICGWAHHIGSLPILIAMFLWWFCAYHVYAVHFLL